MSRWLPLVGLTVGLACRATAPVTPPAAPGPLAAEGESFRASEAVRWVRDSAEHEALFRQVYRAATAHVEGQAKGREPGTWAVVADADETVLDNSLYQVERESQGLGFTPESWHRWTERQAAVPLPGARAFLERVRELGGRIAIVTNRRVSECPDTEAVFRKHALAYDVMLCRPDDGPSDKNSRFESVTQGKTPAGLPPLDVVTFVGNDIRDFPGLDQSLRGQGAPAFVDFGVRYFVLPNPIYGSWE
jgi:5'-nucleotidase (lipoprotein e(P4) family)